ncbi:MAG: hypothetical protein JSR76_07805 [Verrucomicrobia bacterium]|nr:hypothetical protein [Verrucomicrobiota bacterium]
MKRPFIGSFRSLLWTLPFFVLPATFVKKEISSFELISAKKPSPTPEESEPPCNDVYFSNPKDQKYYNYLVLQIENLTNLRNYYDAKIARLRDRADYYQFQRGEYPLDSQALLDRIDKYQQIIDRINGEIIELQGQVQELLKRRSS